MERYSATLLSAHFNATLLLLNKRSSYHFVNGLNTRKSRLDLDFHLWNLQQEMYPKLTRKRYYFAQQQE